MKYKPKVKNKKYINNQKSNNKETHPWEKPLFLIIMTFIGGYMNSYTYITRNKILANMHTANMSKFGIYLALGNFEKSLRFFIPIIACILGITFSYFIKYLSFKNKYRGDWRKIALFLESIGLFGIGLIPSYIPDLIVTNIVSFLMGYQLSLFRKCFDVTFNTTISTVNLRLLGEFFYAVLDEKTIESIHNLIIFTILTFSFAFGTIPGTFISLKLHTKSVWVCSFILLIQVIWINTYENKNKLKNKK